ncbi:D-glycerate dehydrogenase [Sphingomonas panacisoli]|uniref:D-glycerate dehydrogenase n=1 Tax=Sphingomonas panacisoli TaxID=1813879 RepID=A0A5B8LP07_9SPHN|nr:D-glycerate dehydrogenase [Sphingomonas panacisoli]QDZ09132.1 D-glycerate dehydrogenase [Sphingomonas panacisoli]
MPNSRRKPRVIVTRELSDAVMDRMAELFDTQLNRDDIAMSRDELIAAVADADVLVPTVTDAIDEDLIEAAGDRLKLIANFGNGVDHIDLKAARARGILVTNTPGVLTDDTADMTMALILSVPRRLAEGEKLARSGEWRGWSPGAMLGHRIGGKTLGIVGMGRIGQAVAARARAFGLTIHYHNRHRLPDPLEAELGATWHDDLDEMLSGSDFVTIHTPHTDQTEHVIDARRLALLKPEAYLINTSRGTAIDEAALIDALEGGRLAGAGLDVFEHEPAIDPRLLALSNVVLLPHMGSATYEARIATGERVISNIQHWADGHRPPDQVLEGWL